MFNVSEWEERWYRMDSAGINVIYDAEGSVHGIEGGVPQIDGIDATHWTAEQLEQALGTARYSGQSSLIGETERGFRSFPQHRLIVYLEAKGNRFCLFRSGR